MVFSTFFAQNNLISVPASQVVWTLANVSTLVSSTDVLAGATKGETLTGLTVSDDLSTIVFCDQDNLSELTPGGTNGDFDGTETGAATFTGWGSMTGTNGNGRISDIHSNNGTNFMLSTFVNQQAGLDRIYRGVFTTPWDSSTLSSLEYNSINGERPKGIWFNEDYIYVCDGTEIQIINQTDMTWDGTNISSSIAQSRDVGGTYPGEDYHSIMVDPTGKKIFVVDRNTSAPQLIQYNLSTAHDLSTMNLAGRTALSLDTLVGGSNGIYEGFAIAPTTTGVKLYIMDDYNSNEKIHSFDLRLP